MPDRVIQRDPAVLIGARLGSPLVLGLGTGECFLASDSTALAGYADKVVYLDDQQVCVLGPEDWRILNRERDIYLDLSGGNRIPKISERKARSVAELRAAGIGVDRVLLLHDGTPPASDLFEAVLTMLDPQVTLTLVPLGQAATEPINGHGSIQLDEDKARKLGRDVQIHPIHKLAGPALVQIAEDEGYDLIILPLPPELPNGATLPLDEFANHVVRHAHCRVFLASTPGIPQEVVDTRVSPVT